MSPNDALPEVPPPTGLDQPPPKVYVVKTVELGRDDNKATIRTHCRTTSQKYAIHLFTELVSFGQNAWLMATDDPAPELGG